jgi:hypothetical protein
MAMHDDRDLQLLEDDLRKLAEPRDEDEVLRLAVRDQLSAMWRPQPPRRRLSMRLAVGMTAAIAAAAVAVVALLGGTGSGGPAAADAAIIHHALRAVTPPANSILHVEVVGIQNGVAVEAATWQQTSPPYASRGVKGETGHQGEFSDNGRTSFAYDPASNTIYEQRDKSRPTFVDPISQVHQELANGHAQVRGTVMIDGVSLYQIDLPHGLVGYFDENTYQPRYLDDPQRNGGVVRLRVVVYKYLPLTASTRPLLSLTAQHPTARIILGPAPALNK